MFNRPTLLIEQALNGLLLENRLEFLAGKYKSIDTSHDTLAKHREVSDIVSHFADKADPTTKKKHTDHILRWYSKGHIRQEDHPRINTALKSFEANKSSLPEKDLGRYKTFSDLESAVSAIKPTSEVSTPWSKTTRAQKDAVESGSKVIHDDDTHIVRKVNSYEAMKVLGSNTKWCVVPSEETFHGYRKDGPLFHVHDKKTDERFLLHDNSKQYMDVHDVSAGRENLESKFSGLSKRHDHDDFKIVPYDPKPHTFDDLKRVAKKGNYWDQNNLSETLQSAMRDHPESGEAETRARHGFGAKEADHLFGLLSDSSEPRIRRGIARSKHVSQGILHKLSGDTDTATRVLVASNDAVHPTTLHKLSDSEDKFILDNVAKHSNAFPETYAKLAGSRGTSTLEKLADNSSVPTTVLDTIAKRVGGHADSGDSGLVVPAGRYNIYHALAKNYNTSSETLHRLKDIETPQGGSHEDMHNRLKISIAEHPNASRETLDSLLSPQEGELSSPPTESPDVWTNKYGNVSPKTGLRAAVAGNPNTHPDTLHKLSETLLSKSPYSGRHKLIHYGHPVVRELVKNKRSSTETLHNLRKQLKVDTSGDHSFISPDAYDREDFELALLSHPNIGENFINQQLKKVEKRASKKSGHEGVLDRVATKESNSVLKAVLSNPSVSGEHLRNYAKTDVALDYYHETIARNPSTPEDLLSELSKSRDPQTRAEVAQNRSSSREILHNLSGDLDPDVKASVALNTAAPEDVLHKLHDDEEEYVRISVAKNPRTHSDTLHSMTNSKHPVNRRVFKEIADHPNARKETLKHPHVSRHVKANRLHLIK